MNSDHESAAPFTDRTEGQSADTPIARPRPTGSWAKNLGMLALAFVLVFSIKSVMVEPFKIPSGSMIPTLFIGDHIFVNKLAYGLRLPMSDWFGNGTYLTRWSAPKRGDIVVFRYPKNMSVFYVKRVIAVPGDLVEIRDKKVRINGKELAQTPVENSFAEETFKALNEPERYSPKNVDIAYESFAESAKHLMMTDKNHYIGESYPETKVPAGHYFVMGDNRDFSNDSRFWGFVPLENITGRASLIFFSFWPDFEQMKFTSHQERIGTLLK